MICCLNPDCIHPLNPDGTEVCLSCGTPLVTLLQGHYRVIEPLGGGGFGRTYLMEDLHKFNEQCVLKQLAPQVQGSWARQKAIELFEQEAKRLQQLGKQNQSPTLYAYFKQDNYLYLVQEFIKGKNLLQELQDQGIFNEAKIRQLLNVLLPLLQVIHDQHIIHRDIKPENIIRRESDGVPVLIDFGVAKQISATVMVKPGTTIGSFGYAPIEQIERGEAFPASDLYGLGATCFHLLTDIHPWDLWKKQGYGWSSGWQDHLKQSISPQLRYILDKLLQYDYLHRYQSASQVLEDLHRLPPIQIPSTTPPTRPVPPITPATLIEPSNESSNEPSAPLNPRLRYHAVIASSGSWLLALVLLSFVTTIWLSSGLWLVILGAVIFLRSQPIFDKLYLLIISLITTLITYFVFQSFQVSNPFIIGFNGLIIVILLVILAGLLAYILMILADLLNQFISTKF
ncbi:serine/threonine protein kinase [Gloeothece citriformis PCC 7424]|uniref:non-specific serine/threonine protein kinase n=1 Tax=Gloeothece citriformis (strain PCC 7424) TaxID=65393 RepID=B7KFJ6_GLOC7|nr:serine/threonine-protein kinase [Gloeothece citriformis]ACK73321.1 serine/threonine protein kinase [Gloeothece citriformis PCC 7424]